MREPTCVFIAQAVATDGQNVEPTRMSLKETQKMCDETIAREGLERGIVVFNVSPGVDYAQLHAYYPLK